jgi:hypothetical protein
MTNGGVETELAPPLQCGNFGGPRVDLGARLGPFYFLALACLGGGLVRDSFPQLPSPRR